MSDNLFHSSFLLSQDLIKVIGAKPFSRIEMDETEKKLKSAICTFDDMLSFTFRDFTTRLGFSPDNAIRAANLLSVKNELYKEVLELCQKGIRVVTRFENDFPKNLKQRLGKKCPVYLYYTGDISLANESYIGYVGSRNVYRDDIVFAQETVRKTISKGYGVVSGGAVGVDTISQNEALSLGGHVVEFCCANMFERIEIPNIKRAVARGEMLILSEQNPAFDFSAAAALSRNRLIYALSEATIVIRASYGKGGTWSGATDCLKNGWCDLYCRNKPDYDGNTALINKGAIPIDETFDGKIKTTTQPLQMSLF